MGQEKGVGKKDFSLISTVTHKFRRLNDKNATKIGGELHRKQVKGYNLYKPLRLGWELGTLISSLEKVIAVLYVMVNEE